jgi:hypothetical protein
MASIFLTRPPMQALAPVLKLGSRAPMSRAFQPAHPRQLVAFLRHVGCPFAEHTVKRLRGWADAHPEVAVAIVTHGDAAITHTWLDAIGGLGRLQLVMDADRQLYGQWGLGYAGLWHFANPLSLLGVASLWRQGVRNRTATGTRWQRAAVFLVHEGRVAWLHLPASAEDFALPPG